MTDELTPEQEADIRRLLAEARHDGPTPADVVARLDAALGDLTRDDVITYERATVSDLDAARRRRSKAGRLLLAAAAVVVGGVAVGQSIGTGDDMSADPSSGAESADAPRSADGVDSGGSDDVGEATGANEPPAPEELGDYLSGDLGSALSFSSSDFEQEVRDSLTSPANVRREAALSDLDAVTPYASKTLFTCPDGDYGEGARLPAFYDEQEAVLVLRRPTAGIQRVDLLECGTAATLESVDLPAR